MKYLASIFLLSSLAAWTVAGPARAQIQVSESEWLATLNNAALFSASQSSWPSLASLVGKSGTNQTWDFTVATYTPAGIDSLVPFSSSGGLPYESDPEFAGSTNVFESASTYGYDQFTSSGAWELGLSGYSSGTPVKFLGYTPPIQDGVFPFKYQATWSGTSAVDGSSVPSGFTGSTTQTGVVDGWGTLITPPSQSNPALRIKTQQILNLSIGGNIVASDTQYLYDWITAGNSSASIITMSSQATNYVQTISTAGYTNPSSSSVNTEPSLPGHGLNLYLSQNPASNSVTNLIYTLKNDAPVQVEMMDALGRDVRMLANGRASAGVNSIPIDPKTLAAGTYFVRVEAGGRDAMQELTIFH